MSTSKSDLKVREYRARADASSAAAKLCVLDRAREQHELSAARWTELAEAEEARAAATRLRIGEPDAG